MMFFKKPRRHFMVLFCIFVLIGVMVGSLIGYGICGLVNGMDPWHGLLVAVGAAMLLACWQLVWDTALKCE